MTRFHEHFLTYLTVFGGALSYDLEINGEVSFDFRISDGFNKGTKVLVKRLKRKDEKEETTEREAVQRGRPTGVTAPAVLECLYQYPDSQQFNAMLSNMMNELTKVFVRVHKMMRKRDHRRHQETRFRVVAKKETAFFEAIYANMTKEYRQYFNSTAERVSRAEDDPCKNQEEIKEIWRDMLERSMKTLQRAAASCIDQFLLTSNRGDDVRTRNKLTQYLEKELGKIRSRQLHMLCDSFQLCYNDLL